jgi:hypothetical protein
MPLAGGYFETREKAQEAIDNEDWSGYVDMTPKEVIEDRYVAIIEIDVK